MQIGKIDVVWNYAAIFLKIAASLVLLPFILKAMPSQTVGIWSVFVTVNTLTFVFDFGFNHSFTRNITYIFSGIKKLEVKEISNAGIHKNYSVDYGLLKGVIKTMKWLYLRIAIIFFLLLSTLGTYYIFVLLKNYQASHTEVYISWTLLCLINSFNLATLYYDSLLQGKGLIKKSRQIVMISQVVYLIIAALLILAGKGLIAIVAAQASSVIIVRWLSHRLFFTPDFKILLNKATAASMKEILQAIYPNAVKIGLTSLGTVMVQRSAIIIGALYLSLEDIAAYGITMQVIGVIAGLAGAYTGTYQAKIVQMRFTNNKEAIKLIFIKGQYVLFNTYFIGALILMFAGNPGLALIGSKTMLLKPSLMAIALLVSLEQTSLMIATNILSTRNVVPFFKASITAGLFIILGLLLVFHFFKIGVLGMFLIPLIIDFAYQAWKWPLEVAKDLQLTYADFIRQ